MQVDAARPSSAPFAEVLKQYRLAALLSQEALAERARLSARAISDLERGINRTPRAETVSLLADALRLNPRQRAAFHAAARPGEARLDADPGHPPNNLPVASSSLVGRERELAAIVELLRTGQARLLTLTGPGGVGKTRLALEAAAGVLDSFEDGVSLVDLSAVRDPRLVISAIVQTLGLRRASGPPEHDQLVAHLRDKHLLLLLDNFEHVAPAAPGIAAMLASCARLQVLATSRAALRLRGEREMVVAPLALPDPRRMPPLHDLAQVAAVSLFLQRAQAIRSELTLSATMAPAIVEICRRLDGLPLAIELAAAQVRVLPVPALLTRLTRRLPLLSTGPVDVPERQRTMRDTIAWSYDLLAPREQMLFRVLSVCVGGCTLATAEALWAATGQPVRELLEQDVQNALTVLVQQSLLSMLEQLDGMPRFMMLETVREYGLEQLAAHGEVARAEQAHARRFLSLAEEAEPELQGARSHYWLEHIDAEHNNVRTALAWASRRSKRCQARPPTWGRKT